jgi:hypothetical protein
VWHPVGELPAGVYWRRRLVVLVVLLAVLGGAAWLGFALVTGRIGGDSSGAAAGSSSQRVVPTPALERVVPSLTALRTPTPPPPTQAAEAAGAAPEPTPVAPTPVAGGSCTDDMIGLAVRAPAAVDVGSKPTFELVVQNTARVTCVRDLDAESQEIVLLDGRGTRLWGSNDCFPESGVDRRTLRPGAAVSFPVVWGGLTSEPTCAAARTTPAAGAYVLRGRLDTKTTPDTPITLR